VVFRRTFADIQRFGLLDGVASCGFWFYTLPSRAFYFPNYNFYIFIYLFKSNEKKLKYMVMNAAAILVSAAVVWFTLEISFAWFW